MAERLQGQLQSLSLDHVEASGKELGRGAYGVVVEVRVSGLVCAGKTLHEAIVQSETLVKFVEECLCHSQQRHPNIVQLMGVHFSQHSRLPMLVMEYLPLSLTQCLETHQDLPLQIKYSILLDVAKGLNYLHCKRPPIVHRDLTANNILLTSNFIAKISDLGVSRMADTFKQKQLTTAPGNAVVMPPEALKDNPSYDHKLDVFSYGCLILHVFTHQWPEPTDQYVPNPHQKDTFILVSEWNRRSKYTKHVQHNQLLSFIKLCLDNNPNNRPPMKNAIQCIDGALSEILPSKNKLEMMKEIFELEKLVQSDRLSKESEVAHLQEVIQKSEEASKQTREDLRKLQFKNNKLLASFSAKQREITEQSKLIQVQAQQSMELQKQMSEAREMATLRESELQKQLHDYREIVRKNEDELGNLQRKLADFQQQLTEANALLKKSNSTVKSLTDENFQLRSLNERFVCTLKSKDETITILQSEWLSHTDQKEKIQPLIGQRLKQGDSWYLVDQKWLKQWKKYVGFDSWDQYSAGNEAANPGPVDNGNLFKDIESDTLKDHLMEELDYALLPKPVWDLLVSWYGLSVGSQPICRYVVEYGTYKKHLKVEVYLFDLKVSLYPHINDVRHDHFSRATTIGTVIQKIRELFNIPVTDECRLWQRYMTNSYELLTILDQTLSEAGIYGGQMLMLEVKNPDGSWAKEEKQRKYTTRKS